MKPLLKTTVVALLIILTQSSFAQKISKADKYNFGKKYAFNLCMAINNRAIDSTFFEFNQDGTGKWCALYGGFSQNAKVWDKIIRFTEKKTGKFYLRTNSLHFKTKDVNTVLCDCLKFYESAALANFLIKLSPLQDGYVIQD